MIRMTGGGITRGCVCRGESEKPERAKSNTRRIDRLEERLDKLDILSVTVDNRVTPLSITVGRGLTY
mgnify:CR=1 FL=1